MEKDNEATSWRHFDKFAFSCIAVALMFVFLAAALGWAIEIVWLGWVIGFLFLFVLYQITTPKTNENRSSRQRAAKSYGKGYQNWIEIYSKS